MRRSTEGVNNILLLIIITRVFAFTVLLSTKILEPFNSKCHCKTVLTLIHNKGLKDNLLNYNTFQEIQMDFKTRNSSKKKLHT